MAAYQMASRPGAVWQAARPSSRAVRRLGVISAAIEAAGEQASAADGDAACAREDLSAAISWLRAELIQLPVGSEEQLRETLDRQVAAAGQSDDVAARLAEIAAVLDQLPPGDLALAQPMTRIGIAMVAASLGNRSADQEDWLVPRLKRLAAGMAPDDPIGPLAQFLEHAARLAAACIQHGPEDADAAIEELTRCADSVPARYIARPYMLAMMAAAYMERHGVGGEIRHLRQADDFIDKAFKAADPEGPFGPVGACRWLLLQIRGHLGMVWSCYDPSLARVTAASSDLERAAALAGPGDAASAWTVSTLETARTLREGLLAHADRLTLGPDTRRAFDRQLEEASRTRRQDRRYPVLAMQAVSGLALRGLADSDVTYIDRAVTMAAEAANLQDLTFRERPRLLDLHGFALLTRYLQTQQPTDLAHAIDRLEEARRAAEQDLGSPRAASILQNLARAYRTRGTPRAAM